jgi:hypothetical protein
LSWFAKLLKKIIFTLTSTQREREREREREIIAASSCVSPRWVNWDCSYVDTTCHELNSQMTIYMFAIVNWTTQYPLWLNNQIACRYESACNMTTYSKSIYVELHQQRIYITSVCAMKELKPILSSCGGTAFWEVWDSDSCFPNQLSLNKIYALSTTALPPSNFKPYRPSVRKEWLMHKTINMMGLVKALWPIYRPKCHTNFEVLQD